MSDWINIIMRSLFFLVALFLITKWLGKKQISQLSFFEYVTGITIGNVGAEMAIETEPNFFHGVLSIVTFALIPYLAGVISLKNKTFRNFVEGKGTVIIKGGKILEENMKKEKYTIDELLSLLRKKDVFNVADVEFAVLEPAGELTVLLKKENRPLTLKDLGMNAVPDKQSETVIMDGEILDEPLAASGKNRNWLQTELDKAGLAVNNVFLAQIDSQGGLAIDVYNDSFTVQTPSQKPLLLAALKKAQADLEILSLSAKDSDAGKLYKENSVKLQESINRLASILRV